MSYPCFASSHFHTTSPNTTHDYDDSSYYPSPQSALPISAEQQLLFNSLYSNALALLQQPVQYPCMNSSSDYQASNPNIRVQTLTPIPAPFATHLTPRSADNSGSTTTAYGDWPMYQSMGGPDVALGGIKRARSHQRTPSSSTVGSNGPASPYISNYAHPQIANTDYAPQSPAQFADQAFSKNLPTPSQTPTDNCLFGAGYTPSLAAHTSGAHQAMKGFAIDHHNGADFPQEQFFPSRQNMSSSGYDSPTTPQSGAGEPAHNGQYAVPNTNTTNPNVQLWRTESQAYQDELYNPPTTSYSAAPTSVSASAGNLLSPHRNLVTQRLQTANIARSHSPGSSVVSRERSPFRDGSPLAPAGGWRSPAPAVGTAAGMRQQQKEQADQAELAQHVPQLRREPTKTISPKDALLDYNEPEQPSLFQDSIPVGYKQHTGGTEQWQNNFYAQPGSAFGTLQTPSQQAFTNFRATSADGYSGTDPMNFGTLPHGQVQSNGSYFGDNSYVQPKMEPNPEFPAHLTTMESSMSDNGPPPSSQDSTVNHSSVPQRPEDTRAATGTYTCTYHGCTQRFDSHANLQKHKRDFHRSQQQHSRDTSGASGATSSGTASDSSPRSTQSPAPSTSGMTSAAIMARNSQAGPHKCTRINPSTNKPCNTIFSRPYDLTRHEDTIHNGRKQKVRCPMCREEKTFSRNDALTRHMRVVHPEVESFGKRGKRD